ncbi:MAG: FecR domain-containing protein, partial [Kiloniellales bacterium]|nr:FecR domain-containing protein [Kiloniellales bacterium]
MPIVANSAESPPIQLAQAGSAATQLAQAAVPGAAEIGQVTELTGSAFVTRAGGATEPLLLGDPIFLNDIVETGPGATVGVTFIDGTDFTLSGTGRMAIDRLIFNPGGSDNQLLISLLQGTFGFVSGQIAENAGPGMSISTPVGTIGVRGTAGVGDFDLVRLLITLLQGAVLFSNNVAQALLQATFDTLNVSSADQAELTVAPMTPEEQAIYDALLPRILERVEPEAGTEEDGEAGPSDSRASNPTLDVDGLT